MDWSSIIVGALALCGTLGGSYMGVRASNRLVEHRLKSLEEKVNKHNNLVERMTRVEDRSVQNEGRIKELESIHRRVQDQGTFRHWPAYLVTGTGCQAGGSDGEGGNQCGI